MMAYWEKGKTLLNNCLTLNELYVTYNLNENNFLLLFLEKFLRRVRTLRVALRAACNSPFHSNGVINYVIVVRLFLTVLRDRLKNFSRYNKSRYLIATFLKSKSIVPIVPHILSYQ